MERVEYKVIISQEMAKRLIGEYLFQVGKLYKFVRLSVSPEYESS